jgi:hypothetical protein
MSRSLLGANANGPNLVENSLSGGAGVRAAVVHRQTKTAANQFARRDVGKVADYDAASLHDNQATFSSPWPKQSDEVVSFFVVLSFWAWLTYMNRGIFHLSSWNLF